MKTKTFALLLFLSSIYSFAQTNFDISTLRIGPFTLNMNAEAADKIAGKKLFVDERNYAPNHINYYGEIVSVTLYETYQSENEERKRHIANIATSSRKFRTKSGLGVGSTKDQLIDAYRGFSSFSVYPGWNDDGTANKSESFFTLTDNDANTVLSFRMKDSTVVEVSVYNDEGGC